VSTPGERGGIDVPRQLTVNVQGSLGLDDGERLIEELERATGLAWRAEPVEDDGHLTGGIVEIVLVAVLGKSTELVYGAAVEKVRERIEQWRRGHLDKPGYTLTEETTAENAQPEDPEAEA
jgi:hypothetical protein